jgi:hypothetical protein
MLFKSMLLACVLAAVPALPETRGGEAIDSEEVEPQPGIIQFAGITSADLVSIDGEELPAEGLRRARYRLLIAPGIYTLKVRYAETGRTCTSRVVVAEERTVEPACGRRSGLQLAD